jgi:GNAT superfamily N-acetyltransferase
VSGPHACARALAHRLEIAETLIEADAASSWYEAHPDAGGGVVARGALRVVHGAPPDDVTRVWGIGLGEEPEAEALDEAIEEARRRDHRKVTVEWNPYAHEGLFDVFERRGLVVQEFTNTYVRDARIEPAVPRRALAPRLRIERIDPADPASVEAGARAWATGIMRRDPPGWLLQVGRLAMAQARRACFGAIDEGRIVGVGTVALWDGVAFLGMSSTLASHRAMGVQSHLLHARLEHARDHGADLATMGSDPGTVSQRNIERAGFACVYTKLIMKRVLRPKRGDTEADAGP